MSRIENPIEGVVYQTEDKADFYLSTGAWVNSTVGETLRSTAAKFPDRSAFVSDERTLTFRELDEQTDLIAGGLLDIGLMSGDRVLFQLGTTIETVLVAFSCYKAGIVPVCTIPQYREVEIDALGKTSKAKAHFVQADFSGFDLIKFAQEVQQKNSNIEHIIVVRGKAPDGTHALDALSSRLSLAAARERLTSVSISPRDVLSFQLSGGSTGLPKIIPRFHAEYIGHAVGWSTRYQIDCSSCIIWSLPLIHNAGQSYALLPPIIFGLTAVLMPKVDIQRMLELIEIHKVTHGLSIGPIAPQLIAYTGINKHDLSSLKLFSTMSRADKLEAHLGVPCSNLYGITEGLVLGSPADDPDFVRHHTQGATGTPCNEIRVLDPDSEDVITLGNVGELCFRGPYSLLAYYGDEVATKKALTSDGFFRSGDMVIEHVIDGRSYFAFQGRLRDNINRGGEKIGCEEVEEYVCRHPAIADAKLVAMPDPFYGEKGCIYLILRKGFEAPNLKALADFLAAQGLAKFKCPERIEIVDAFPVTRVGKVDKALMRQDIAQKLERENSDA
ncbi:AMP-binding protein [Neopusillimonas maritima]|uniref:Long-chain-fatty-acid--CoA ligase n=1 Tax=Neopusillimonas maritima TaxID=2026239 RepID=A0ABX9N0P7_9BURK|nr:AMP-binding protein [Neopusillimonas maritima]RII83267.1 2,3-dihydroxybenzoate-AMP ligase [Neopusillimonas maritima]